MQNSILSYILKNTTNLLVAYNDAMTNDKQYWITLEPYGYI